MALMVKLTDKERKQNLVNALTLALGHLEDATEYHELLHPADRNRLFQVRDYVALMAQSYVPLTDPRG